LVVQTGDHNLTSLRRIMIVLVLCVFSLPAYAEPEPETQREPWYAGRPGRRRLQHLAIAGAFGASYLTLVVLKPKLIPDACRWCEPSSIDRSVRNALVWNNTGRANFLSNLDTYVLAPAVGFGLLIAVDHDAGWARFLDDVIPVAATVAVSGTVTQMLKISVGRRRPEAQFGDPGRATTRSDNLSFVSGHSSLGFAITASAGLICHWRHYWTEPYVWGAGIALSLSTEYLRMGADKHYLSDVLAGGAVGLASGLLIPRLMRRNITIVPSKQGAAIAHVF
jgi:membrane-associated phospholipid phosphatase